MDDSHILNYMHTNSYTGPRLCPIIVMHRFILVTDPQQQREMKYLYYWTAEVVRPRIIEFKIISNHVISNQFCNRKAKNYENFQDIPAKFGDICCMLIFVNNKNYGDMYIY